MLGRNVVRTSNFEPGQPLSLADAGFAAIGAGTISLDSTAGRFAGTRSMRVDINTAAATSNDGFEWVSPHVTTQPGETWTLSFLYSADPGAALGIQDKYTPLEGNPSYASAVNLGFTATGGIDRMVITWTWPASRGPGRARPGFRVFTTNLNVASFWVDNIQFEKSPVATTYHPHVDDRSPGELVTRNYQYEFNGFLFGSATETTVEKATGLLGLAETEVEDSPLQGEHGAAPGQPTMSPRRVEFDLHLLGGAFAEIEDRLDWMRSRFQPQRLDKARDLRPLVFQRPGKDKQQLFVRCEKRDFASAHDVARGHAAGSVLLVAPDPVIYSLALNKKSVTLLGTVNLVRLNYVENRGDHPDGYKPTIDISGPCRDPSLQHVQSGLSLSFVGLDVQAGETLKLDFAKRTALVGSSSKTGLLNAASRWFRLLPGMNSIDYSRSGAALNGANSIMDVYWRDTSS